MRNFFIVILIIVSCTNSKLIIESISYSDLEQIKNHEEVSCLDYIKIASSIKLIDSIFQKGDTSVVIFKDLIKTGIEKPVIMIDGNINFKEWITKQELDSLKKLKKSKQISYRLTNSNSSMIDTSFSNIGREAEYLINLYLGKRIMNSDDF